MDLLTLFFCVVMCAFAYILGYRQKEQENSNGGGYKSSSKQYNRIGEDHFDEEALVERTPQPKSSNEEADGEKETKIKDQQKEIDRLMRELTDFKKREQKNTAEIQYLKTKITSSAVPTTSGQKNTSSSDLITDKAFTDLLDEASQNLKDSEEIDEDELSKQIDQSLL